MKAGGARSIVLAIGDELLLGRTLDTNSAWLADRLSVVGVPVSRMETVPDDHASIVGALRAARSEAALVVTTGGLGPTDDDRTRAAIDEAVGEAEPFDEIPNARGTEPGRWVPPRGELGGVLALPGPPREMTTVFTAALDVVEAALGDRRRAVHTRTITTTGISERKLAPLLQPRIDGVEAVEIAFLPDLCGVDVRLTVRDRDPDEALRLLDSAQAEIAEIVAPWEVTSPSGDVVEALTDLLVERGWTLAVAESCTGGGIGERMTARPGASRVFLGGVIAYADGAKASLLGVAPETIARHGAVSEEVAEAMARGAARAFGADCGIGITGIAGPGGGSDEKPVGTVCWAAHTPDATEVVARHFIGDREGVRRRSGEAALVQLLRMIERAR
ncbi:MAG: nicotinamide-nucleotide amidohydrolase family protein [Longimicrobiales bacterium]|nr:nicotinamide-nucleotide amidohydrolase family protein [Longimicrobiales bacterium]